MYKKGKDGKIKGIENLDGLPDYTIYKTDKIESIMAFGDDVIRVNGSKKPEGFEGW
jgi:hypothetical protein